MAPVHYSRQPRLALPGERVGLLILCWHGASYVEVFTLERQARTDKFTEEVAHRFAAYTVYDQDYEKIGNVDDLFLDQSDQPEYIGVKMGFLGTRTTLIPVQMARVDDGGSSSRSQQTSRRSRTAPPSMTTGRSPLSSRTRSTPTTASSGLPPSSRAAPTQPTLPSRVTQTTGRIKEAGGTKDNVTDELDEAAGRGRRRRDDRKEAAPEEVGQPGSGGVKANVRDESAESQSLASRKIANRET